MNRRIAIDDHGNARAGDITFRPLPDRAGDVMRPAPTAPPADRLPQPALRNEDMAWDEV